MVPTFEQILARIEPIVPALYGGLDQAAHEARAFFDEQTRRRRALIELGGVPPRKLTEPDPHLFSHLLRWFGVEEFRRRGAAVVENPDELVGPDAPLTSLLLRHDGLAIRILKEGPADNPIPLPDSHARRCFYNQQGDIAQAGRDGWNLIAMWSLSPSHTLKEIRLALPLGFDDTGVHTEWIEPIPHPATTITAPPLARPADDDDIGFVPDETRKDGDDK